MTTGFGVPPISSPSPTAKKLKQTLRKQFEALDDPRVKKKYYIGCVGEINATKDLILKLVRYG